MRVAIIHPWLPQYRVEFFDRLRRKLEESDIQLDIFYGQTPPDWSARNDSATLPAAQELPTRFIAAGSRSISIKNLESVRTNGPYDLLILEQAIRNLETYKILLRPSAFSKRLALWGHGKVYTKSKSKSEVLLYRVLTNKFSWFFAYTAGGAEAVAEMGFSSKRVSVVGNSMDTRTIANLLDAVTDERLKEFKHEKGLTASTALYIGGIDSSKRIEFLLDSGEICYTINPAFRLLCVGSGEQEGVLKKAAEGSPWLRHLPANFGADKALALRAASALAIPGRVGLVAVDSLVSGVPIVTTRWPFHAPEFEYIDEPELSVATRDDVGEYAKGLLTVLDDPARQMSMRRSLVERAERHSIERMVENFAIGVEKALQVSKQG